VIARWFVLGSNVYSVGGCEAVMCFRLVVIVRVALVCTWVVARWVLVVVCGIE